MGVIPEPPVTIELKGADATKVVSYHFTNAGIPLKSGALTCLLVTFVSLLGNLI